MIYCFYYFPKIEGLSTQSYQFFCQGWGQLFFRDMREGAGNVLVQAKTVTQRAHNSKIQFKLIYSCFLSFLVPQSPEFPHGSYTSNPEYEHKSKDTIKIINQDRMIFTNFFINS